MENEWKTSSGSDVVNRDLFERLDSTLHDLSARKALMCFGKFIEVKMRQPIDWQGQLCIFEDSVDGKISTFCILRLA